MASPATVQSPGSPASATPTSPTPFAIPSSLAPHAQELIAFLWAELNLETLWEPYQSGLEASLLQEVTKLGNVSTWDALRAQMQVVTKAGDALQAARTEKQGFENGLEANAIEIVKHFPETVEYVKEWIAAVREQDYEPRKRLSQAFKRLVRKAHEDTSISEVKAEPVAKATPTRRRAARKQPANRRAAGSRKKSK